MRFYAQCCILEDLWRTISYIFPLRREINRMQYQSYFSTVLTKIQQKHCCNLKRLIVIICNSFLFIFYWTNYTKKYLIRICSRCFTNIIETKLCGEGIRLIYWKSIRWSISVKWWVVDSPCACHPLPDRHISNITLYRWYRKN